MIACLELRVDGVPATKGSWRIVHGRKLIPDNPGEPEWAERVGWAARAALRGRAPDRQRYRVRAVFTLPPVTGRGRKNRRDIDKLVRSILDALTGLVWLDDEQVDEVLTCKGTGPRPGVDLVIESLDDA